LDNKQQLSIHENTKALNNTQKVLSMNLPMNCLQHLKIEKRLQTGVKNSLKLLFGGQAIFGGWVGGWE
jgi:hypothetical protein